MAFLRKGFQLIRYLQKHPSAYQDVSFDGTNLPDLAAERIACFLDGKDLINLGKTCKFWNEVSRKNMIWKTLVMKRFGRQAISSFKSSQIEYKKLYFNLAKSKKAATAFQVVWLNGDYLEKVKERKRIRGSDSTQYGVLATNQ